MELKMQRKIIDALCGMSGAWITLWQTGLSHESLPTGSHYVSISPQCKRHSFVGATEGAQPASRFTEQRPFRVTDTVAP